MFYLHDNIQAALDANLVDWCKGGPRKEGWTRTGLPVRYRPVRIVSYFSTELPVEEILAKNRMEAQKWHIGFLETLIAVGKSKFYWKKTTYYREYLKPRLEDEQGFEQSKRFISLIEDVIENGVRRAVWVADVSELKMPFRYFRFDGCHRACCAKICGIPRIPTLIFRVAPVPEV
jgi:hypothetical protein